MARTFLPNPTSKQKISLAEFITARCNCLFCFCLTSNSDDNLLKNIELFDKLVLRFNGRVLFVKDVLGDEICCWSFYGEGRKIAEVCCTSIVYATEKKQTKVSIEKSLIGNINKSVTGSLSSV